MTDKEIKAEVISKIKQGFSKLDIYNQLKDSVNDDTLRKIISSRPSNDQMKEFKTTHLVISIIWGIFMTLELLGAIELISNFDFKYFVSIMCSIYITINIWKFDGRFLLPGIIWFLFTIFNLFREIFNGYEFETDFDFLISFTIIYSVILLIGTYIMYHLKKNVFNYYNWFQPEMNTENERRFE